MLKSTNLKGDNFTLSLFNNQLQKLQPTFSLKVRSM